jgi:hypothetical protein
VLVNVHLSKISAWLAANKLSLNIEKTNFVIFRSSQKRISFSPNLYLNQVAIKEESSIRYLGIYIDCNLNWKIQIVSKKIKRNIGILSKLRYYVSTQMLTQLYYSIIYPFITYGLILWGNTYESTLNPLVLLQKRAVRAMTFSKYDEHTSPLFFKFWPFETFIFNYFFKFIVHA